MADEIEVGWEDPQTDQPPRPRARYNWRRDPVASAMVIAMFTLVILALTAGLYAALVYRASTEVPRTREEKEIAYLETVVKRDSKSARAWYDYAQVLIGAGQFNKAESVLDRATDAMGANPAFDLQRARILYEQGSYERAAKDAEAARKREYVLEKKSVEEAQAKGYKATAKNYPDEVVIAASILIAEAHTELGNLDEAIDGYTAALKEDSRMADVLYARGDLYEKQGDLTNAEKDYTAALKFVPDMEEAQQGLERVQKGSGR